MAERPDVPDAGNRAWRIAGGAPTKPVPVSKAFPASRAPFGGYGRVPGVVGASSRFNPTPSFAGRSLGQGVGIAVHIDLTRLGRALGDVNLQRSPAVSMAINKGVDRMFTWLKREISKWSGIPVNMVAGDMRKRRASPGKLEGAVIIMSRNRAINGLFSAAWGGPSTPGGTHDAWNNPQTAKGSFLVGGTLKTRTTASRFPIKSLWGPNPAREVVRHQGQVEAQLNATARTIVVPEIVRLLDLEFKRVKAKYGL